MTFCKITRQGVICFVLRGLVILFAVQNLSYYGVALIAGLTREKISRRVAR